ncbi:MAG: fumarylacetoacetate hydrolase family protein [Ignavibacteriales bacterium]|nr:fumarylacetoacetate hydrolase family protein [Ignavibacteriales bacterium]
MKKIKIIGSTESVEVKKILCLGRNYLEHAKEMNATAPKQPVIFMKPATAVIIGDEKIIRPSISKEMHHEIELVVAIGENGKNISKKNAYDHVVGYAVGLDMTLRDLQSEAKKQGLPWTLAKGFDTSAPLSDIAPISNIPDPHNLRMICRVNGEVRQNGYTGNMIFSIPQIIEYISKYISLEKGDLIFTGTPEGVSEAKPGDIIEAEIEGIGKIVHEVTGE